MIEEVHLISAERAKELIFRYHYSKVMPRLNRMFIGGFLNKKLVGVMTLGWGTRPLHTIKKIFPTLETKDYLELGKLCMAEELPRNSESNFIAKCIKFLKRDSAIKLLFSWADGILGKPGYVYQASNFFYGGFIWSEMYLDKSGNRIHARTFQGISAGERVGKMKSRSLEVTNKMGLQKYFGKQFRYIYPLCDSREWRGLQEVSPMVWKRGGYPKDSDCQWKTYDESGKLIECNLPPWKQTEAPAFTKSGKPRKEVKMLIV